MQLLALGWFADLPSLAAAAGFQHWMFAFAASLLAFAVCLRNPRNELRWLAFTAVASLTILMVGQAYDSMALSTIVAAAFVLLALMTLGALLNTELAEALRIVAAAIMALATMTALVWHLNESPGLITVGVLAGLAIVSIVYAHVVRRLGWLAVFGIELTCLVGVVGWNAHLDGALVESNWPIPSGLLCFVIGLTITSVKTGVHRRLLRRPPHESILASYQSGL